MTRVWVYSISILFLILLGCGNKKEQIQEQVNESISDTLPKLYGYFVDSTNIGVKGQNKLELLQYSLIDNCSYLDILFFEKDDGNWKQLQKFNYEMSLLLDVKDAIVQDYNNDGHGDFIYPSLVAARGGNRIQKLFVYSPIKKELVYIHNSEDYPNLGYNTKLDCLDAFALYGGSTTYFLKIKSDSLQEFVRIDSWDNHRTVIKTDEYGKEIILKEDTITEDKDSYIRYENFNSLEEYTED